MRKHSAETKHKRPSQLTTENIHTALFLIDINSTPHYIVILHALHNLSFSFTINFTFNNHKTIVELHYNFNKNIFDV